ncbi:UNVERIFIED_CONTAM: hypothetical protein GTU68_026569 [Idotea baltica]|nr:hypothetical protein [Idotea baltica]
MSGGVDSSVSAYLLAKEHDIIGVSMQVWDYRQNGGYDFTDARKVAAEVDVPYYVFDFENTFREKVIDKFINTYLSGETPNPCVDCNNKVKFKELRERAEKLGCEYVATGHYAQIEESEKGFHLIRGEDIDKDQSYFLYGLKQEELSKTLFPVGHLNKSEVRKIAEKINLTTANKPESQDICFVSGNVKDFIEKHGEKMPAGNIINTKGDIIGKHDGIHSFTVGQRKGLGIGGTKEPLYVLEINSSDNSVIAGTKDELEKEFFYLEKINWLSPYILEKLKNNDEFSFEAMAQLRYRHDGIKVDVEVAKESVKISFQNDWTTVTPGQACVLYDLDNREVHGGGRISNFLSNRLNQDNSNFAKSNISSLNYISN